MVHSETAMGLLKKNAKNMTISEESSIVDAVKMMQDSQDDPDLSSVFVLDSNQQLSGILTERDVVWLLRRHGGSVKGLICKNGMTSIDRFTGAWVTPETHVSDIGKIVSSRNVRHVPVIGPLDEKPRKVEDMKSDPVPPKTWPFQGVLNIATVVQALHEYQDQKK